MGLNSQQMLLLESAKLLAGSDEAYQAMKMLPVLEDVTSPVTVRATERLFSQVIDKKHIDFDKIPDSKGDIRTYAGYATMKETLYTIKEIAEKEKNLTNKSIDDLVDEVLKAIENIEHLSDVYSDGFKKNVEYTMLEYNTYVMCCVEATTALLCGYVNYVKFPSTQVLEIKLVNNKYRADAFYMDQLKKFNAINKSPDYRKFLTQMNEKGMDHFTGTELVGLAAIMIVAMSIVPITRTLIYYFYNLRRKLSDSLMMQAMFLELHKTCLEANQEFTKEKRDKIIAKQEKIRVLMVKLADKLRVTSVKANQMTKRDLEKDNRLMTFDTVKKDVDSESFSLL
ncbi:MAG TPA: hypothetical protein DCW90_09100 [Lachnospiraceae bacterium]|nr:hypothetical protein [Lachnospiraceae bacterium]